jgi:hypothetical protein
LILINDVVPSKKDLMRTFYQAYIDFFEKIFATCETTHEKECMYWLIDLLRLFLDEIKDLRIEETVQYVVHHGLINQCHTCVTTGPKTSRRKRAP